MSERRLCIECGERPPRKQRRQCHTCRAALWRARQPLRYLYCNLRTHAKERGKGFHLRFDEFVEFCLDTGYHLLKGRNAEDAQIDRVENRKGYALGNIRLLTCSQNSRKGTEDDSGLRYAVPKGYPF